MVVKIMKSCPSVKNAMDYNERKVACGDAELLATANVRACDASIQDTFRFLENRNIRSRDISFHMSVNPSATDGMTEEKALGFIDDLMKGLGYENQPYAVYKHTDIDREHYHVVSVKVNEEGRKIKDYYDKRKAIELTRQLADKYGYRLGNGDGERAREQGIDTRRFDPSIGRVVAQMEAIFKECCSYHFTSFQQFQMIMQSHGLSVTHRAGDESTILLQGLDKAGKACTAPVDERDTSLSMYEMYEQRALQCYGKTSIRRRELDKVDSLASFCLPRSTSQKHFENMLRKQDIDIRIHRNSSGGIMGATFVDHATRSAFKCSELPSFKLDSIRAADASLLWHESQPQHHEQLEKQSHNGPGISDVLEGLGAGHSQEQEMMEDDNKNKKKGKKR